MSSQIKVQFIIGCKLNRDSGELIPQTVEATLYHKAQGFGCRGPVTQEDLPIVIEKLYKAAFRRIASLEDLKPIVKEGK